MIQYNPFYFQPFIKLILTAGIKPLLTEFGIYHTLEGCANHSNAYRSYFFSEIIDENGVQAEMESNSEGLAVSGSTVKKVEPVFESTAETRVKERQEVTEASIKEDELFEEEGVVVKEALKFDNITTRAGLEL